MTTDKKKIQELENELEKTRIQLVACSMAATGNFTVCHKDYDCVALQDVLRLRQEYDDNRNDAERYEMLRTDRRIWSDFSGVLEVYKHEYNNGKYLGTTPLYGKDLDRAADRIRKESLYASQRNQKRTTPEVQVYGKIEYGD